MNMHVYFGWRSKGLTIVLVLLMSMLLAVHGPMVAYTSAQTAAETEKIKQKVLKELDRRVVVLQKSLDTAKKRNTSINKSFERTIALDERSNKSNNPVKVSTDVTKKAYEDSKLRQQNAETSVRKTIVSLKELRNRAASTTSYPALQELAKNTDAQYGVNRLVQVQAAVVTAVDNAKLAAQALQDTIKNHRAVLQNQFECYAQVGTATMTDECKSYVSANPRSNNEANQRLTASLDRAEVRVKSYAAVADSSVVLLGAISDGFTSTLNAKLGVKVTDMDRLHQVEASKLNDAKQSVDGLFASLRSIVTQLSVSGKLLESASADLRSTIAST